ncbi:hypothetical protein ACOME3_003562 [Neoechinorhynchus agilis]
MGAAWLRSLFCSFYGQPRTVKKIKARSRIQVKKQRSLALCKKSQAKMDEEPGLENVMAQLTRENSPESNFDFETRTTTIKIVGRKSRKEQPSLQGKTVPLPIEASRRSSSHIIVHPMPPIPGQDDGHYLRVTQSLEYAMKACGLKPKERVSRALDVLVD